jgi:hypothetical protein
MPLAMVERVGAHFGNGDVHSYGSRRTASRYGVGEIADDDSAREASRSSTAHRRALERATEFPAGWKGEAWAKSEDDDELGADGTFASHLHAYIFNMCLGKFFTAAMYLAWKSACTHLIIMHIYYT